MQATLQQLFFTLLLKETFQISDFKKSVNDYVRPINKALFK